jgi:hypothetical protein
MTTTITDGSTSVVPLLVLTAGHTRTVRTITHDTLGERTDPDVTLRPATTRHGTLELFFDNQTDALTADALHRTAVVLTLTDSVDSTKNMSYVSTGGDMETRREVPHDRWLVTVPYREVIP